MKTNTSIQLKATLNTTKENLWSALTEVKKMKEWYFIELQYFIPEIGFKTSFKMEYQDSIYTHQWKVFKVIPFRELAYYWQYEEYDGNSTVAFEIQENQVGVELILKANIIEPFPEIGVFSRESMVNGWKGLIYDRLQPYLEKK